MSASPPDPSGLLRRADLLVQEVRGLRRRDRDRLARAGLSEAALERLRDAIACCCNHGGRVSEPGSRTGSRKASA